MGAVRSIRPNYSYKSNPNSYIQTHKKLDNVTLNMYYGMVSTGLEPGGRQQERIP